MRIYESSRSQDVCTLVATQSDWISLLASLDPAPVGDDRRVQSRIVAKIMSSLSGAGDIVRVSMSHDDARWVVDRSNEWQTSPS